MTHRISLWPLLGAGTLAAAALCLGSTGGCARGDPARPSAQDTPVAAPVRTAPIQAGRLESWIQAYGSVVPAPGASRTVSLPYDCRVDSIAVQEGQRVGAGAPLARVSASPDALLALTQARIDAKASAEQLHTVQGRFQLKLADSAQLAQAQQAADAASAKRASLEARHLESARILRAPFAGVVARIPVQPGGLVPAGGSLVELVDLAHLEARLGVEPAEAARLRPGTAVTLVPLDRLDTPEVRARVRAVAPVIDPAARLRMVYVTLAPGHSFLLGQGLRGKLLTQAQDGLIVPYPAVLPKDGHQELYTVQGGRAVRREVRIQAQDGDRVQVQGEGLKAGERVVVQGNYELEDGMAVREGGRP